MARKKLLYSQGFASQFLKRVAVFLVYWGVLVAALEAVAWNSPLYVGSALRAVYSLTGYVYFSKLQKKWLAAHGDMPGDKAIIKSTASSFLMIGGLCAWYTMEDFQRGR